MGKLVPSLVAGNATHSAPATLRERGAPIKTSITPHIAATTCDRESKTLMEKHNKINLKNHCVKHNEKISLQTVLIINLFNCAELGRLTLRATFSGSC